MVVRCLCIILVVPIEDQSHTEGTYDHKLLLESSVTSKKLANDYKSCPKMISPEKLKILTPLQKLPNNVGDFGKLIVVKGFEKLPKVQSGHTVGNASQLYITTF